MQEPPGIIPGIGTRLVRKTVSTRFVPPMLQPYARCTAQTLLGTERYEPSALGRDDRKATGTQKSVKLIDP